MLTYRLVRLIEYHSEELTAGLLHKVSQSERTRSYANAPMDDLKTQVSDIYHHLGTWLLDKSSADVEQRYTAVGARRAQQNIALSDLVWAIVLTKHNLWEFIDEAAFPGRTVGLADKQELLQLMDEFFDTAIHAAVVGYEWATHDNSGEQAC
jgi:hypothetical protein